MYDGLNVDNRIYLIYCDIGTYKHWVTESNTADSFFKNFDKLVSALQELSSIDYQYREPTPYNDLQNLLADEQNHIQHFLSRSWIKTISEASKLKTDSGKSGKIKKFFDSLEPYKERFSVETLQLIEKAKSEAPDYTLKNNCKAEKDAVFLAEVERDLSEKIDKFNTSEMGDVGLHWFHRNSYLLSKIMCEEIEPEIIHDIEKLMLSDFDQKKSSRFLRLKYKMSAEEATQLYIVSQGIVASSKKIIRYKNVGFTQYKIITNSCPCPTCKSVKGKVLSISNAKIGFNFPPLCKYNCSTACAG